MDLFVLDVEGHELEVLSRRASCQIGANRKHKRAAQESCLPSGRSIGHSATVKECVWHHLQLRP